ncbi:arginine deiminase [Listeria costaricensis]|uniref:arginine deiminase n=1 Tax=Listeria costaricensis TaxID=2026604 RepID=UPI000C077C0C|nr:arginine deiminase [Listeria costaricensis]
MKPVFNIHSEIDTLRKVIVKRPGRELENLTPDYLKELLFDDIPFLPIIQKEHDFFVKTLQDNGAEVLYLEKLVAEAIEYSGKREQFLDEVIREANQHGDAAQHLKEYLLVLNNEQLIEKVMTGVRKDELPAQKRVHLDEMMEQPYPFYLDPLPNLYFTRDPAAVIGHGISINPMFQPARRRESYFISFILKNHPSFTQNPPPVWLDRNMPHSLEGGDELVLNQGTLLIGVSERTDARAIEQLARNLFIQNGDIKQVIALEIPETRAFMHLDTVFTMVNEAQFTIHPKILSATGELNAYVLQWDEQTNDLNIHIRRDFEQLLKELLHVPEIDLIPCGGEDAIASAREQWNDGANTLAIAPGEVITYDRNQVSNRLLREHGIKVHEVISSELSRGRGGPRCMTMPIYRGK